MEARGTGAGGGGGLENRGPGVGAALFSNWSRPRRRAGSVRLSVVELADGDGSGRWARAARSQSHRVTEERDGKRSSRFARLSGSGLGSKISV
jgi:hypothetical protein